MPWRHNRAQRRRQSVMSRSCVRVAQTANWQAGSSRTPKPHSWRGLVCEGLGFTSTHTSLKGSSVSTSSSSASPPRVIIWYISFSFRLQHSTAQHTAEGASQHTATSASCNALPHLNPSNTHHCMRPSNMTLKVLWLLWPRPVALPPAGAACGWCCARKTNKHTPCAPDDVEPSHEAVQARLAQAVVPRTHLQRGHNNTGDLQIQASALSCTNRFTQTNPVC